MCALNIQSKRLTNPNKQKTPTYYDRPFLNSFRPSHLLRSASCCED